MQLILNVKKKYSSLNKVQDVHSHNTRNKTDPRMPKCSMTITQQSSDFICFKYFNKLPSKVKNIKDNETFKSKIKQYFIDRAFYSIEEFLSDSEMNSFFNITCTK